MYTPRRSTTTAMATATRPCMNTDMSRNGLAMVVPYPFFAGVATGAAFVGTFAGFACAGGATFTCGGVISADNWKLNVCTAVVLFRFLDFNLLEVAGPLQSRNKVRDRVDRSRRTFDRQARTLPRHRRQPKIFRPGNRV